MIQWKLGCRSRKQKRKNQPIAKSGIEHCHWFILPLLLATPIMQFSLDRKQRRHKQNQCSASDSVVLILTRSYHSTLVITTPTTIPLLVKTSLYLLPTFDQANECLIWRFEWKSTWKWTKNGDQKPLRSRMISPHPYIAQAFKMFPKGHPRKMIASYFFSRKQIWSIISVLGPLHSGRMWWQSLVTPLLKSVMTPLRQYNNQSGISKEIWKQRYSNLAPKM